MDSKSHELFAQVLLDHVGNTNTPSSWGIAPDIDLNFLHRWYRHRISVLPKIYQENLIGGKPDPVEDKDAITLCIVSHLYLDIFNGLVFPFGAWHPIVPNNTIIQDVLSDLEQPNMLIEDLKNLSGYFTFNEMFYQESKGIMQEFALNLKTQDIPTFTKILVSRLALYSGSENVYGTAMKQIAKFTPDENFTSGCVEANEACEQFERSYADLITRATG
jgi:hypothetical protein